MAPFWVWDEKNDAIFLLPTYLYMAYTYCGLMSILNDRAFVTAVFRVSHYERAISAAR